MLVWALVSRTEGDRDVGFYAVGYVNDVCQVCTYCGMLLTPFSLCSVLDSFMFTIGAAYFVAGSYPPDAHRCYRPLNDEEVRELEQETRVLEPHEIDMQTGCIDDL